MVGLGVLAGVLLTTIVRGEQISSVPLVVASGVDAVTIERLVELDRQSLDGARSPAALAMTSDGSNLYLTDTTEGGSVLTYARDEPYGPPVQVNVSEESAGAIAVDPLTGHLVTARASPAALVWRAPADGNEVTTQSDPAVASAFADGIVFDRSRGLAHGLRQGVVSSFVYDPESNQIGEMRQQIDVTSISAAERARGLSVDPVSGSLYLGLLGESRIFEIDSSGQLVRILDLGRVDGQLSAFTVAASSDPTDRSGTTSVFVVNAESGSVGDSTIVELGAASVGTVGLDVVDRADLVQTISMADIPNPGPDSSAITWLPAQGRLLVADSEVDEYDFFTGVNTWTIELDGTVAPVEISGGLPSDEPTGLTVSENLLFVTDDVAMQIHVIDLGPDAAVGVDDTVVASFSTQAFGCTDPEDVAFDGRHNRLYVVDGMASEVFIIDPGPNGMFEGFGDDIITQFDVAAAGIRDPEGIAYDPERDAILIVDRKGAIAVELGPDGDVLRRLDLSAAEAVHLAGVVWAPGSKGGLSLWAVDRGVDGPLTVDGRIFELTVPPLLNGSLEPSIVVRRALVERRENRDKTTRFTVEVENRGTAPLRVTDVRVHGTEAGAVTILDTVPRVIPAAGHTEFAVEVAPRADVPPGSRLVIESSDPNLPRTTVELVVEG